MHLRSSEATAVDIEEFVLPAIAFITVIFKGQSEFQIWGK